MLTLTQIGIKPRDELAGSAGIKTASRGGFIINKEYILRFGS